MRISWPFPIKRKGHEDGAGLKSGPFPIEKKGHEGWSRRNSVEIRAKFGFGAGRAQSFSNPKNLYSGLGLKVF